MTRMGGGSLEASEWSSDSMAAGRSQSKDGGNVMSPPKSGVAVAWDLGGPGEVLRQLVVATPISFLLFEV